MLKHFTALFIVLVFAGQTFAGGFACENGGSHRSAAEMSCCEQAKSGAGVTTAMLCCQTVCGETTSGTPGPQSETVTHQQLVPVSALVAERATSFNLLLSAVLPLSKRSADALVLNLHSPALYLHNSTFLI